MFFLFSCLWIGGNGYAFYLLNNLKIISGRHWFWTDLILCMSFCISSVFQYYEIGEIDPGCCRSSDWFIRHYMFYSVCIPRFIYTVYGEGHLGYLSVFLLKTVLLLALLYVFFEARLVSWVPGFVYVNPAVVEGTRFVRLQYYSTMPSCLSRRVVIALPHSRVRVPVFLRCFQRLVPDFLISSTWYVREVCLCLIDFYFSNTKFELLFYVLTGFWLLDDIKALF